MENNELMTINEGIEAAVEIVEATSHSKSLSKATTFGLGVVVGVAAYNCVLKPIGAKTKTWLENRKAKHYAKVPDEMEYEDVEPEDEFEDYDE